MYACLPFTFAQVQFAYAITVAFVLTYDTSQEISDGLVEYLSTLMVAPKPSELEAAQQKTYVTYTSPENASHQVTVLESRGLLLAAGTTGMRTWEASLHMGAWLATEALDVVKGKNVLELGAGMGFLSIFCAKCLDSQYMLATDGDTGVVENFTENVSLNELEMKDRIDATVLQWGHPLRSPILNDADEQRTFDVVLGADVVSLVCKPEQARIMADMH